MNNAYTERWSLNRAGGLTGATIRIAGLAATMTDVLVRLERLDGTTQVTRLTPSRPSFVVEAAPTRIEVAGTYTRLGVEHILTGVDHLLYVLAMLLLVSGWKRVVATMTAFTATHSLTLTAATLGWVHVPQPPVEACIALSIVFVAREIARSREGASGLTERWPWVISFTFGLLHGFGFAGALSEVGLPAGGDSGRAALLQPRCRDRPAALHRRRGRRAGVRPEGYAATPPRDLHLPTLLDVRTTRPTVRDRQCSGSPAR